MNITIVTVGKIKEKYLANAIAQYSKKLSKYCKLEVVEVPDEKTPDNASDAEEIKIKQREGEKILKVVNDNMYLIALAIEGKKLTSGEFQDKFKMLENNGISSVAIVIGGSLGLSDAVLKRSDYKLSFSNMTFPHQLMRVILLEQLVRCFK
jgi:23S rRNA (pseudouridine1915-N3)-methyltransferase